MCSPIPTHCIGRGVCNVSGSGIDVCRRCRRISEAIKTDLSERIGRRNGSQYDETRRLNARKPVAGFVLDEAPRTESSMNAAPIQASTRALPREHRAGVPRMAFLFEEAAALF